ncbi:MAG: chromosome partitioning protein [Actinomycetota bacterium]|nr:chromosome partitioning protein [Actinomycetota bacterium]
MQVLLAAAGEPWETDVVQALQRPGCGLTLVRRCMDVADAVATAVSGQADAVLFGRALPGLDSDVVARVVEGGAVPVGLVEDVEGPDATALGDMGMVCLVHRSALDDVAGMVQRARQPTTDAAAHPSSGALAPASSDEAFGVDGSPLPVGRVIACWGPTGAPGRSTVALGLASELSARSLPTLLLDVDVHGGALAQMLAMLDEVSGVLAAGRLAGNGALTLAALHGHVREINPCLRVLTGLPRADRWPQLRPSALVSLLRTASQMAPFVILDCGFSLEQDEELSFDTSAPRRNGATLAALERADVVLAIGSAEPLGLARLARGVLDLTQTVPGCDPQIVVNRVRGSLGWTQDDIAATLERFVGRRPVAFLPEDRAAVDRTWVDGRTLTECAPDSALREAISGLATTLGALGSATHRRRLRLRRR